MGGTYSVAMGDRGRFVIPAELRDRLALSAGSPVLLLETSDGLILTTRPIARRLLREQLAGKSLVAELLADRRTAATAEDG